MSNYQLASVMNTAFGNPKGEHSKVSLSKLRNQCKNIPDEVGELFIALGADKNLVQSAIAGLKWALERPVNPPNLDQIRDSLGDIHVFTYGANHIMGIDADDDYVKIINGVMTRFVKDEADLKKTIARHYDKGVKETYTEGEFPTMIVKSAKDQPDAPKGKFLKSASYQEPVFTPVDIVFVD